MNNIDRLNKQLERALDAFSTEIQSYLSDNAYKKMDMHDAIEHIGRHTFYTLFEMKDYFIKYAKEQERRQS